MGPDAAMEPSVFEPESEAGSDTEEELGAQTLTSLKKIHQTAAFISLCA